MNGLFAFLGSGYMVYIWLIIAVMFLLAELSTPGLFFFIAFAKGACVAAFFAFLGFSLVIQCLMGLLSAIICFFLLRYYFVTKGEKRAQTNMDALKEQKCVVVQDIKSNDVGQVKVKGEIWSAQSKDNSEIPKGEVVSVVVVKGNRLIVKV